MEPDEIKKLRIGTELPDGRVYYGPKNAMYVPGSHPEVITPEEKERRHKAWQKAKKELEGWGEK